MKSEKSKVGSAKAQMYIKGRRRHHTFHLSPFPFHLKKVLRETEALLDIIYKVSLLDVWQLHTVTLLLVLTLKEHTDEECNNAK